MHGFGGWEGPHPTHPGLPGGTRDTTTYLRPDSMNLSYSTDILQQSAWRVRSAEQLVLMTRLPAELAEGSGGLTPSLPRGLGRNVVPGRLARGQPQSTLPRTRRAVRDWTDSRPLAPAVEMGSRTGSLTRPGRDVPCRAEDVALARGPGKPSSGGNRTWPAGRGPGPRPVGGRPGCALCWPRDLGQCLSS